MIVLGIETSCDECSAAVVEDGKIIHSNVIATQIDFHRKYNGVVPELASRMHTEWITGVVRESIEQAGMMFSDLDGIAVTNRPGLVGSLLVGLSYAKGLGYALGIPLVGVNHIQAHLYAPHLEFDIQYPYLGLLVSGGHTIISLVEDFDQLTILGTTIDDACGEAFDKVAKYYEFGYPGGIAIDQLARKGDDKAFSFPGPNLHKGDHQFDVSYSGLKTAAINQLDQFHNPGFDKTPENIAASFERTAVNILLKRVKKAVAHTGVKTLVAGGGVVANTRLREELSKWTQMNILFPSLKLCTDNGAMIAGIGYQQLKRGDKAGLELNAAARVEGFRKKYP